MRIRWTRLAGTMLVTGGLAAAMATPVAAAECALNAPGYVNVGSPLSIAGSGFPASSSVDIELSIEGGASDAFSQQADAAGALQIALVPEDIDIGVTTVQATAGSTCTASVTYTVLAAGATPPPAAPTEEPGAGTGSETGSGPVAPRTDTVVSDRGSGSIGPFLILILGLIVVASVGLYVTGSPKRE